MHRWNMCMFQQVHSTCSAMHMLLIATLQQLHCKILSCSLCLQTCV
jgi:hypothetical protein